MHATVFTNRGFKDPDTGEWRYQTSADAESDGSRPVHGVRKCGYRMGVRMPISIARICADHCVEFALRAARQLCVRANAVNKAQPKPDEVFAPQTLKTVVFISASHPDHLAELPETQFHKEYPDAEQYLRDADIDNSDCPNKDLLYFQSVFEGQCAKVKDLNKAKKLGKKGHDPQLVPELSEFFQIADWWISARSQ